MAEVTEQHIDALDTYIAEAVDSWGVPGLSITIIKDDVVLLSKGYGVARLGDERPVDEHTVFGLLSPTKTMTAVAIGMLVDEGRLTWDDRVQDHLPDFELSNPEIARRLTVRDLLSHRSGYADEYRLWYKTGASRAELLERMKEVKQSTEFRSEFRYNNLMYVVAGEIIRVTSGVSWDEFLHERIFDPLRMTRTMTAESVGGRDNVSSPHARRFFGAGPLRPIAYPDIHNIGPAGAVFTSAADSAHWLRLLLNDGEFEGRRLVSASAMEELRKPHIAIPTDQPGALGGRAVFEPICGFAQFHSYGLGLFVVDYRGHVALMHGGGMDGQRSAVGLLPEHKVGVAIFSNKQGTEISLALMYKVFDLFLETDERDWSEKFRQRER